MKVPQVRVDGALRRIMQDGDFRAAISLGADDLSPATYGVGAAEGLHGEITIFGGRCWTSRVVDGHVETHVGDGAGVGAALLVRATVDSWRRFELPGNAALAELGDAVRGHARAIGLGGDAAPLVFRVGGSFETIGGHVIDGSKITPEMSHAERHERAVDAQTFRNESGMVLGFVSESHQGVFTHHGENVHAHAILAESGVTVHVEALTLTQGTVLEIGATETGDIVD